MGAAGLRLNSWADSIVLSSWNFDETLNELEFNDGPSDDDKFELRVHSERHDDDTWIEDCDIEDDEVQIRLQVHSPVQFQVELQRELDVQKQVQLQCELQVDPIVPLQV
jgi:hypothetical protein